MTATQTDTQLAATLDAITDASATIDANDSLFHRISQTVIAAVVVVVWGVVILTIIGWTLINSKGGTEFICNTPPTGGTGLGTDCTNGWVATKDQLKDVFTFGILPFLSLVIGFYFGQKSSTLAASA